MTARVVPVALGDRSYSIQIAPGMLASGGAASIIRQFAGAGAICVVTHPRLAKQYALPLVEQLRSGGSAAHLATVAAGERSKRLPAVARLYRTFLDSSLDRRSLAVAIGGGVLGDLVGFASATYLRGIDFIQVPTTLLAQVDASVGGKTGVDLAQGKNLVGAFHQPKAVLIDPLTLRSLPQRELLSGLAEVVKYGIISDDSFFVQTQADMPALIRRSPDETVAAIARSCEIKAGIVAQDETEQGERAILNFGHTVGHALETATGYRSLRHGEAVSIGMVSAALLGEEMGVTKAEVTAAIRSALESALLPVHVPAGISPDDLLAAMRRDKKSHHGKIRFVLAPKLGSAYLSEAIPEKAISAALSRQIAYGAASQ